MQTEPETSSVRDREQEIREQGGTESSEKATESQNEACKVWGLLGRRQFSRLRRRHVAAQSKADGLR